jgi:uncharacterized protein
MTGVFLDAAPLIALINPRDQHHKKVVMAFSGLGQTELITTDAVLTEMLNYYAERGVYFRARALEAVKSLMARPDVNVVHHSKYLFHLALERFEERQDKGYSLTDCLSMIVMETHNVQTVLTTDSHFRQAGFTVIP